MGMSAAAVPTKKLDPLQQELDSVTDGTAKISMELIAATKAATEQILHFGGNGNFIRMNTLGGTLDEAMMVRMMGQDWRTATADVLSRTGWQAKSPIVEIQLRGSGKYLYFHPTSGGRLRPD